jgi:hypothetical protein
MTLTLSTRSRLLNLIAASLIFLYVYTAISKLLDTVAFKTVLAKSSLLNPFDDFLVWFIPVTEILISIMLFFPVLRKHGFILSTALMSAFSLYIGYMLLFIPHLPCSCGGVIQQLTWSQHLIFNLVFCFLSFYGWIVLNKTHSKILLQ